MPVKNSQYVYFKLIKSIHDFYVFLALIHFLNIMYLINFQ